MMMLSQKPSDHTPKNRYAGNNDRGSALIGVVIVMVIIAAMGGIMVTMNATSSVNQFGSMDGFRAFYLAESGGRYAIPVINKNIDAPDTLIPLLDGHTFSFSNGDSFQLSLSYAEPVYTLVSTGILNQGPRELHATRQITYRITKNSVRIDFPFDDKKTFKENFTFDGKKGKIKDKKKELDGTSAVELKDHDTFMQLDWTNDKSTLPNLAAHWLKNGELLSYDMQVKIKIIEDSKKKPKKGETPEYIVGLTFRDTSTGGKNSAAEMYGLSFVKIDSCSDKHSIPEDFCSMGLSPESLHVVLWRGSDENYTLIDSHEITGGDILDGGLLSDWSTLVVKVEEEYVLDANGNRQDLDGDGYDDRRNLISGSMQGANLYPRDTIDWDFTLYQDIPWDSGAVNPIIDSALTTETFGDDRPVEMGIHSFVDRDYVKNIYVDDFSIQLTSGSGSPSSVVQY